MPTFFTAPDAKQTNLYLTGTMCLLHGSDLLYVYHLPYGFPSLMGCFGRNNRPKCHDMRSDEPEHCAKLTAWKTNNKDIPCASLQVIWAPVSYSTYVIGAVPEHRWSTLR